MINSELKRVTAILCHPIFIDKLKKIDEKERDRRFCKHGLEHLLSVARIAEIINLKENLCVDEEMIYSLALLHDIGRSEDGNHEENGVRIANVILEDCGFSDKEVDIILKAIANHRHNTKTGENKVDIMCDLLKRGDHLSRNCFYCEVKDECNWSEERKNKSIEY